MKCFTQHKNQDGYTFLELLIVVMIVGLLVAPLFALYRQYHAIQAQDVTVENVSTVTQALNFYKYSFGSYPCPAPLDVKRGEPGYGISTNCSDDVTVNANDCGGGNGNGYCVVEARRQVVSEFGGTINNQRVRRGAVPFVELGLTEQTAYDGYGSRLIYVVTEDLADPTTPFDQLAGGIDIVDQNGNSVIDSDPVSGSSDDPLSHYVIFSTGEDKLGGFNREGNVIGVCPADPALQNLNCRLPSVGGGPPMDAVFRSSLAQAGGGDGHMDDVVRYFSRSSDIDAWKYDDLTQNHIHLSLPPGTHELSIGVAGANDSDSEVNGAVRTSDDPATPDIEGRIISSVESNNLCDLSDDDCMNVLAIAGDNTVFYDLDGDGSSDSGVLCSDDPTKPYMRGLENNKPFCVNEFSAVCPYKSFFLGFDDEGRPKCEAIPCNPMDIWLCNDPDTEPSDFTLPLTEPNTWVMTPVRGTSRQERYACNSSGEWERRSDISPEDDIFDDGNYYDYVYGVCECNPLPPEGITTSVACPDHFSGSATATTTTINNTTCRRQTVTDIDEQCSCQPYVETQNVDCAVGTDSYVQERNVTCVDGAHDYSAPWVNSTADTCSCDSTITEEIPCEDYETGGPMIEETEISCSTGEVVSGPTITNPGVCVCNPGAPRTIIESCPAGKVGTGTQPGLIYSETYDCDTGTWVRDPVPVENCIAAPPGTYVWVRTGGLVSPNQASCGSDDDEGEDCTIPGQEGLCCRPSTGGVNKYQCTCQANPDP